MKNRIVRAGIALLLAVALCVGWVPTAFAVSGQVTFTGVDTVMIYNPLVDHDEYEERYSTLSTGNMSGQIKLNVDHFSEVVPGEGKEIPFRDVGPGLREQVNGFTPVISGPADAAQGFDRLMSDVTEGTVKTFFYWPDQGEDYQAETAEFICVYEGDHCLIWGYDFSDAAMAREMGEEFDDLIYANNTAYFGTGRFMEQGAKLNILIYTFHEGGQPTGIIGFFWGIELYTEAELGYGAEYYNAGMPIIHINSDICTNDGNMFADYGAITVAHEHQHLVCMSSELFGNGYWSGASVGTWLNEAMAQEAEELSYPGTVVENGYIYACYNISDLIGGGQSLYHFGTSYNDIGVYGQGFLFSEYIKQLNGGPDVFKKIHDHWRTAPAEKLTDAETLYAALPLSVRTAVLDSVTYPASVTAGFGGEADAFLSKLALSFHVAAAVKEEEGIYGMPENCAQSSPRLYADTRCDIECGGRIFVRTKDGNSYTVPADADSRLIYVGFKDGEVVIPPTTAENYALSAFSVTAKSDAPELGTVSVSENVILAAPAEGCGYAVPAYEVVSGSARVEQCGNAFLVRAASDCTVRIRFERRSESVDLWDGSVADSIPTEDGIYVISTCAQLAALAAMVNAGESFSGKTVRLAAHLDLNGLPWTPIGRAKSTGWFKGVFDGNGYTVSNLTVGSAEKPHGDYAGLFGYLGDAGSALRNIVLKDASVYGKNYAGGLAGYYYNGSVSNCMVSGSVSGSGDVGLLMGRSASVDVVRCAAVGTVTASGADVGGLIGYVYSAAVGGSNQVTDCFSNAHVSGAEGVGGLVGRSHSGITLTGCYWTGTLSGGELLGGIVGNPGDVSCAGCFYAASGCAYGAGDGTYPGISPLSDSAMKDRDSYVGWDFAYIWRMSDTANDGLPYLAWQKFAPRLLSDGLRFDRSAVSEECRDLAVSLSGNGNDLLGLVGVEERYVTVTRGRDGASDTLLISLYYLNTLPVGCHTLYARYSNGFTVPFTVEVVDTAPEGFVFKVHRVEEVDGNTRAVLRLSAPEEKEVSLVLAAYVDGQMVEVSMVTRTLTEGFNEAELTLSRPWETGMTCAAFLMTEEGLIPLTAACGFNTVV